MYKVIIIDDEEMIRTGLCEGIPWAEINCEIVGVADNGVEALNMLDQYKPDIVVTDIRMPGCSGIEVADYALKLNANAKVVLLSGYNDFEYAQQAIHIGVYYYMLKPTVYEELKNIIITAVKEIEIEVKRKDELEKFRAEFQEQLHLYRSNYLRKLIVKDGTVNSDSVEQLHILYGMQKTTSYYFILFKPDEIEKFFSKEIERQYWMQHITSSISELMKTNTSGYFVPLYDEWFSIVYVAEQHDDKEAILFLCEQIRKTAATPIFPLVLTFGVSRKIKRLDMLNQAYFEAMNAIDHMFYIGSGTIIFYDDLSQSISREKEEVPYTVYTEKGNEIIKALQIGNEQGSLQLLKQLYGQFHTNQENPLIVRAVSVEIVGQLLSLAMRANMNNDIESWEELHRSLLASETSEAYYQILERTIAEMSRNIFQKTNNQHKRVIEKIIQLVEKNYAGNINLEWLSSHIHLNSNYLSRLIKKEIGLTFTELLTNTRIENAKQLLKDPTCKIYEVSERVGFEDAQYFSAKFKKETGITPKEYRDHSNEIF